MPTCGQIMTHNPTCCLSNDTVQQAAQAMKDEDVGSIPIVDSHQAMKLVGIVTDRDLALKVVAAGLDPHTTHIDSAMTPNPITCRDTDDLRSAMNAMADNQVRRMPVINSEGRLVGIIAQADVATRVDNASQTAEVVEEISKPSKVAGTDMAH